MKIVRRAVLKHTDGQGQTSERICHLLRIEEKVYRWVKGVSEQPFDGIDYLDEPMAIKAIRVAVETSPEYVGVDLTIYGIEPTPVERAAKAIEFVMENYDGSIDFAAVIERETNLSALLQAGEEMFAYLFTRQAFKDMALAGLMMTYLEAVEKTKQADLSNLKKRIADSKVDRIIITPNMPGRKPQ